MLKNGRMILNIRRSCGIPRVLQLSLWLAAAALGLSAPDCCFANTTSGGHAARQQNKTAPSLAHEIRHQLAQLPFYSEFDFITFTLDGKNVTLTGQVLRPSLKKHAEAAVKSLEGVDAVTNQIEVLPVSAEDNEIRRAVYRAIYEDPVLAPYAVQAVPSIHIIVKNASVALEGTVKSPADKSLAGRRAENVDNVKELKNNLKLLQNQNSAE